MANLTPISGRAKNPEVLTLCQMAFIDPSFINLFIQFRHERQHHMQHIGLRAQVDDFSPAYGFGMHGA